MAGEDPDHLKALRAMRCAIADGCDGPIEPHHPIGLRYRGMSQRSHDHLAIPLCRRHHADFHGATGYFKLVSKAERRAWQDAMSAKYQPKVPPDDCF